MVELYHLVPDNMKGDILYPLNELEDIYPDIYRQEKEKYRGREEVMNHEIPYLDCMWNDVLHLTAVHPKEIKEALDTDREFRCFVIDPHMLDPENAIVYLYEHEDRENKLSKDNFVRFDPNEADKYSQMPKETKEYYQRMQEKGKRPLLFVRIPHILYKGHIDVSNLDTIEV